MRPRLVLHEAEAETKTNFRETETEIKKWSRDHAGLETLTFLSASRLLTCARLQLR